MKATFLDVVTQGAFVARRLALASAIGAIGQLTRRYFAHFVFLLLVS